MILHNQEEADRAAENKSVGWTVIHKMTVTDGSLAWKLLEVLRENIDKVDAHGKVDNEVFAAVVRTLPEGTWKLLGLVVGLSDAPSPALRRVVIELAERGVA